MDLRDQLQAALGDSYKLGRELGGGGMSRVFVAEEQAFGRQIVVKVLSPDLAADVSTDRFAREIRLAAQLQQANIVPLLTAGESFGLPYYTMPFVEGESLKHRLTASGALPISDAVNVLRDVARALAYAHERGIVHRDIKPENVLLSGDAAVVTDFGIAKAISASRQESDATLTSVGTAIGTPAYMAPEQAIGDPNADHRADVYSFGCLAYEVLTGSPPFRGRTGQQLLAAHVHDVPPTVETLRKETPPQLALLVDQCLRKDPASRPQRARDILHQLDAITTPSRIHVAERFRVLRRRPRATGIGIAVVLFASVATVGLVRLHRHSAAGTELRRLVVLPFTNVGGDSTQQYFADGVAIDLTNALSKVPGLRVASRSLAFAYAGKPVDVRTIGKELSVDAALEGAVQRSGGRLRVTTQLTRTADGVTLWSNRYERENKDLFSVQDEITKAIIGELRLTLGRAGPNAAGQPIVAGTSNLEAYDLYLRGVYLVDHRGPGVARSIDYFRQAIALDSAFAPAYGKLSYALELLPYFADTTAASVEARAISAATHALAIDSTIADAHIGLALARDHAFRWSEAAADYRRAIADDSTSAIAHTQYGRHLMQVGRIPDAIAELTTATRLDPASGTAFVWLAHNLSLAGRHDSALVVSRHAREIDPGLLTTRTIGAMDELAAGHAEEARALVAGIEAPAPWRGQAAFVLGAVGDRSGARSIIRDLERLPSDNWMVHTALAYAFLGLRDTTRALAELEAALRTRESAPKWNSFSDRMFDPVRSSGRFAAVVRGFGLDDSVMTSPNGGRPAK